MKQIRIGDITIDAVIEREGPWRRPQDFFPRGSVKIPRVWSLETPPPDDRRQRR
ncbi:hypothetical protein ACVL92_006105 [Bradyrhizobium liaoningense]